MGRVHQNQRDVSRITAGGRKLTYQLKVIQEPERARACGSGAKSSADRRPVDPPPVVELRIFEGDGPEKEDITFGYSANFFLFATLEVARPIANGRVHHHPPPQQVPVLTGMPVSGMAYLDRPTEAGYFIFPDLSVRHEGAYKLSFNLYEETKNAEDADAEPSHEKRTQMAAGSGAPDSSFDWRLEVKSHAFTVYSAKKFPGLSESTALSRTVAEQGCRVRIRRDVRMRRRDGKPAGDYDEDPVDGYVRGRPSEQDPYGSNLGSANHSSEDASTRNTGEFSQPYGQYQSQQQPGFMPTSAPPYQNSQSFAAPLVPTHQPYQQPHGSSYPQQAPPQQQYPVQPSQPSYNHDIQHPQSAFPTNPPREVFEPEPRRASFAHPPSHTARGEYPPVDSVFNRQQPYQPAYTRPRSPPPPTQTPVNLPPIVAVRAMDQKIPQPSPLAPVHTIATYPSESYDRAQDRPGTYGYTPVEPPRSAKRTFDNVFKSSAGQSLFNGQRPTSSHADDDANDDEDEMNFAKQMVYKRADGASHSRKLPTLEPFGY